MGYAVGCIGLSVKDFDNLTPIDFEYICERYETKEQEKKEFERLLSTVMLQPYCKDTIKPTDVLTFSWEKKSEAREVPTQKEFEELVDRWR